MTARSAARTRYGRQGRSRFLSGLLLVFSLALVMLSGFLFGRFVIGEGYLRQTVTSAAVSPGQQSPSPGPQTPSAPVSIPPLVEEPPASSLSRAREWPEGSQETPPPAAEERPAAEPPEQFSGPPLAAQAGGEAPRKEFTVQVGNFLRQESAEALAEQLRQSGKPARVVSQTREGITSYLVVSGAYPTESAARGAANALREEQGYEAFIIRAP